MKARKRIALAVAGTLAIGVGGGTVAALLAGGEQSTTSRVGRALTVEEAERFAAARLQLFRGDGTHFRSRMESAGSPVDLSGDVDFRRRIGLVQATIGGRSSATLQWSAATLAAWPSPDGTLEPPAKLPTSAPELRSLDPATTPVDAMLALMLALGQERADDAEQVRQSSAAWLRRERVDGVDCDVVAGPAAPAARAGNVVYWIGPNSELRRVEAYLGGGTTATRVDLDPKAFKTFDAAKDVAPTA